MRNFKLEKNGHNWISVEYLENGDTKLYKLDDTILTKEEAIADMINVYGGNIIVDGIPASEYSRSYINKGEFRNLIMNNYLVGKTVKIGDVSFNEGVVYNPRINEGRGYQYVGANRDEKLVNNLWRIAKKVGMVSCGNEDYYIQ